MLFGFGKSALQRALARGAAGSPSYRALLSEHDYELHGAGDVVSLKAALAAVKLPGQAERFTSDLEVLLDLMQGVEDAGTVELIRHELVPVLLTRVDEALATGTTAGFALIKAAKLLAAYCTGDALPRIAALIRAYPNEYSWSVVFAIFDEQHPFTERLFALVGAPLPAGFAAVAFLDFCNSRALAGSQQRHAFDSEAGVELLRGWLTDPNRKHDSYAHSATVATLFVAAPAGAALLALAAEHASLDVRVEAAWVGGKQGQTGALAQLSEWCLQVPVAQRAKRYLEELGHPELVPAACLDPAFQACVEMSDWLAHPSELGQPPKAVKVAGSWEVFWPPTQDRRRLYVIHYEKQDRGPPDDDDDDDDDDDADTAPEPYATTGYGLVGSVTFALFGENTSDLQPLHVLALHCCWELEQDGDLSGKRSVTAGLKLLVKDNPQLARELPS